MAGIPVFASNLPQMKKIIDQYGIGKYVDPENDNEIVNELKEMMDNMENYSRYKANCLNASKILNWENEFRSFEEHLS